MKSLVRICLLLALFMPAFVVLATPLTKEEETNLAAVRLHHDLLNKGDVKGALAVFSPDTKNFGRTVGRAGMSAVLGDIYKTFPDFKLEIVNLIARDNQVWAYCKSSGTHEGVGEVPVNGGLLVGVPATHKHFEIDTVHIYTLKDGLIVDHIGVRDDQSMMTQLGLTPAPAPFDWAAFMRQANANPTEKAHSK